MNATNRYSLKSVKSSGSQAARGNAPAGFKETRRRGSHRQFRHPDGRATTIPFHKGRDISPILLRQVAKDIELTLDKFLGGNFD